MLGHSGGSIEVDAGGVAPLDDAGAARTDPVLRARTAWSSRFVGWGAEAAALLSEPRGRVFVGKARLGEQDGWHLAVKAAGRVGIEPLIARALAAPSAKEPSGGWLAAEGWSGSVEAKAKLTRSVGVTVSAEEDLTSRTLLDLHGFIGYAHPCRCISVDGFAGKRLGRDGIDVWVSIDLAPRQDFLRYASPVVSASDRPPRARPSERPGEPAAGGSARGSDPPAPRSAPATLLAADDDRLTRELLANILRGHGYVVETCDDGQEAVERVSRGGVNLVLLDIMMPRLSGLEACRLLKGMTNESFLPVVLVTVKTDTASRVEGLKIGADDYVCKPFDERELVARVEAMLRIKRLHDHVAARARSSSSSACTTS